MGIGTSSTSVSPYISGSGSNNQILLGDSAVLRSNNTALRNVMDATHNTASRVLESGDDILASPAVWLKDMQENWLTYIIVAAIILSILAFFYRSFCRFSNQQAAASNSNLIELAKIFSQNNMFQRKLPSSMLNGFQHGSNTQLDDFRV
ncbi:hypothetical protein I4U23_005680 [Adineta vaga]|nr:hypothetical protein I4U23_005680 [Adineta vaga]